MAHSYAYLSQGQLHIKLGNDPVRPIDSKFGESVRERAAQIHNRNSWKTQGPGAKFMSGGLLWGRNAAADDPTDIRVDITGISRGCKPGELFYSLSTPKSVESSSNRSVRLKNSASSIPPTSAYAAWPQVPVRNRWLAYCNAREANPASQ